MCAAILASNRYILLSITFHDILFYDIFIRTQAIDIKVVYHIILCHNLLLLLVRECSIRRLLRRKAIRARYKEESVQILEVKLEKDGSSEQVKTSKMYLNNAFFSISFQ